MYANKLLDIRRGGQGEKLQAGDRDDITENITSELIPFHRPPSKWLCQKKSNIKTWVMIPILISLLFSA